MHNIFLGQDESCGRLAIGLPIHPAALRLDETPPAVCSQPSRCLILEGQGLTII